MPIQLTDTNSTEQQSELLARINAKVKENRNPKYFSDVLTGDGKRKTGFFSSDADTFNNFMLENRRMLDILSLDEALRISQNNYDNQTFGSFSSKTKEKKEYFMEFEHAYTTDIAPVIIHETIGSLSGVTSNVALSFPYNTPLFMLNDVRSNNTWIKITDGVANGIDVTTYALPVIQSICLYSREVEYKNENTGYTSRKSQTAGQPVVYVLFLTIADKMTDGDVIITNSVMKDVTETQAVLSLTPLYEESNTFYNYNCLLDRLEAHFNLIKGENINRVNEDYLESSIGDQSMSDVLTNQANNFQHIEEVLLTFVRTFTKRMAEIKKKEAKYNFDVTDRKNKALVAFVQTIDTINEFEEDIITTSLLSEIYEHLNENIDDKIMLNKIVRHSLRLLLSQRLHQLDDINKEGGLYKFEAPNDQVKQAMEQNHNYSIQQKKIIMSRDPLVIGQAGAGSGKSHTLVGRINYLKDQGEDLTKVLVLSFTNVAALNITNRFPSVRSETLANMFHKIYSATYPNQSLSQPSTVANSLRLLNPKSQYFQNIGYVGDKQAKLETFIGDFARQLEQFDQTGFKRVNLQVELRNMSNLIEKNLDMTTHILDAVEQTTLELEPIIIHHRLLLNDNSLNIPQEYRDLNYIITDESQDISTFEYILLLELTIHHRSQLLIIGDGSQTLYEFRNSDPRYMNALEESGVFTNHKLQTNYRSNQEILTFANQLLQVIDANKHANIQLRSNQFRKPTVDSFKESVIVDDHEMNGGARQMEYIENLVAYIKDNDQFKDWFLERVRNGEQVAIMGWTRKEVLEVGELLDEIMQQNGLGHIKCTSIMSNNERPMTILSRFSRTMNQQLRSMNPTNSTYANDLKRLSEQFVVNTFNRSSARQKAFYERFINENVGEITRSAEWNAWLRDFRAGNVNEYQIGSFLIQQLLRAETRRNAIEQYLRKQKEVPNYDEIPVIISTIHGTKGLEFDHTVVLYNESKRGATSQETLRMMFVALSRAKKTQYIINTYRATTSRTIGNTLAAMYQTPMNTAYMRALDEIKNAQ